MKLILALVIPGISMILNGRLLTGILALALQFIAMLTTAYIGYGVILWLLLAIWAIHINSRAQTERELEIKRKKPVEPT